MIRGHPQTPGQPLGHVIQGHSRRGTVSPDDITHQHGHGRRTTFTPQHLCSWRHPARPRGPKFRGVGEVRGFFWHFSNANVNNIRMDRMDGTSTARAGFRFVGLLLAGVWHSLSGDLPPPPQALVPPGRESALRIPMRALTGHAIIATPAAAPVHWRGAPQPVPVLFFIVTSVDARTNIYIRSHPPAAAIVPLCCLLSCFPLRLRIENCRLPTVDRRLSTPRL